MRVVDLDRDMRDVIPTGTTLDSSFLFDRMTERTLRAARPGKGRRILDCASGLGQDAMELARRGATVVAAEPSSRMSELARYVCSQESEKLREKDASKEASTHQGLRREREVHQCDLTLYFFATWAAGASFLCHRQAAAM